MAKTYLKKCERCGREFEGKKNSRFCSDCMRMKRAEHQRAYERKRRIAAGSRTIVHLDPGGDNVGRGVTHTLEETAAHFGTSKQNIRQIEANALRKLRKGLEKMGYTKVGDLI